MRSQNTVKTSNDISVFNNTYVIAFNNDLTFFSDEDPPRQFENLFHVERREASITSTSFNINSTAIFICCPIKRMSEPKTWMNVGHNDHDDDQRR